MSVPRFDLRADDAAVLVVDMQEKFVSAIPQIGAGETVHRACQLLLQGAALFSLPLLISQQYPRGLGQTLPELAAAAPAAHYCDKLAFSCLDDADLRSHLSELDREQIIVAGIEAHICVLATVDDLLMRGYQVVVAADAIASRRPEHLADAIASMRQLGALVLPTESILFRLQRQAGDDRFKALSALVR